VRVCSACGSTRSDDAWICADCGSRPEVIDGFTAFAPALASSGAGFREDYFADLAAIEANSFWFRARSALIIWAMRRYVPDVRSFLEIGCGTGFVLRGVRAAFPSVELSGSEVFTAGLGFAAQRVPSARFYQMDARHIPFRDEFDVIGAFDVIEHIDEDEAVIAEVAGALRPGGSFVITVPQHPALWSVQDAHAFHVRRYVARDLRHKLETAGFEVLRMTSFVSLLLPFMFASRQRLGLRQEAAASEFDAIDAVRLPWAVNQVLEAVMAVERALIRGGLSFPVGGSLLVVARKRTGAEAPP
jgi:SAM-dependent methyltransferase